MKKTKKYTNEADILLKTRECLRIEATKCLTTNELFGLNDAKANKPLKSNEIPFLRLADLRSFCAPEDAYSPQNEQKIPDLNQNEATPANQGGVGDSATRARTFTAMAHARRLTGTPKLWKCAKRLGVHRPDAAKWLR